MANVLVVDDVQAIREVIAGCLSKHEVTQADGVMSALEVLTKTSIDLIITDLSMPARNDGYRLINSLDGVGYTKNVLEVSSYPLEYDKVHYTGGSVVGMKKPIQKTPLVEATNRLAA